MTLTPFYILKELVKINSENPPTNCIKILEYVRKYLKKNTKSKVIYQPVSKFYGNVIAIWGIPKILINVHLDTVPASPFWKKEPFKLKKNNGKLYGLGTTDIKGGVAAILSAISKVEPKNMLLLFSSDEEQGNSNCIKTFLKSKFAKNIKYGIVTEPTNLHVLTSHRGNYSYEFTFTGKSVHAALPEKGVNAIELASQFIMELNKYKKTTSSIINVGIINGGVKSNVVPDKCVLKVNIRPLPNQSSSYILTKMKKLLKKIRISAKIKITYNGSALKIKEKLPVVDMLVNSGAKKSRGTVNYGTEAPLFTMGGIPSVVFGPGDIRQAHIADEFIRIKELEKAEKIYKNLLSNEKI